LVMLKVASKSVPFSIRRFSGIAAIFLTNISYLFNSKPRLKLIVILLLFPMSDKD